MVDWKHQAVEHLPPAVYLEEQQSDQLVDR